MKIRFLSRSRDGFNLTGRKRLISSEYALERLSYEDPHVTKEMVLFPERINSKIVAVLTVNTDIPPAKIAIAYFDDENQIWSEKYWAE